MSVEDKEMISHRLTGLLAFILCICGQVVVAQSSDTLTLQRVMLSTGGVGYFEHEARVDGDTELELQVRFDQVDDVLKSIVVYDDAGGVGTISLPGREPLAQIFRDLPFSEQALGSTVGLLNALQGTELSVSGQRELSGRLIRVVPETAIVGDGGRQITRHRVSLMTPDGIRQFVLEEAESLRFQDERIQAQINDALAALAQHRTRDKRTLRVKSTGNGRRTVRVGYVVGMPLWKTTYRLTVSGDPERENGVLQGWAVLENMSGQDWHDVALTMVSGNPVTFRQALYSAYYVDRPSVPVEVLGRVLPTTDAGALRRPSSPPADVEMKQGRRLGLAKRSMSAMQSEAAEADMLAAPAPAMEASLAGGMAASAPALAESQEAATQVLFHMSDPISVQSGHSVAVPIVNRTIPAKRLSLYQPETHATHPLASVRLTNDGDTGLPPGVLTLYERDAKTSATAYLGDARLNTLPAGDERLVSFAVDQKVLIDKQVSSSRNIANALVERGVLRLTRLQRLTTTYRIRGAARESRRVLIEQPRRNGWKLVTPPEDQVELTQAAYRVPTDVVEGEEAAVEVTMERPVTEQIRIDSLSPERMIVYAESKELAPPMRRAFARVAELRRAIDTHRQKLAQLEERRGRVFEDQARLRENLRRISKDSDVHRRYIKKLEDQETELENLVEASEAARARLGETTKSLADYISGLNLR